MNVPMILFILALLGLSVFFAVKVSVAFAVCFAIGCGVFMAYDYFFKGGK